MDQDLEQIHIACLQFPLTSPFHQKPIQLDHTNCFKEEDIPIVLNICEDSKNCAFCFGMPKSKKMQIIKRVVVPGDDEMQNSDFQKQLCQKDRGEQGAKKGQTDIKELIQALESTGKKSPKQKKSPSSTCIEDIMSKSFLTGQEKSLTFNIQVVDCGDGSLISGGSHKLLEVFFSKRWKFSFNTNASAILPELLTLSECQLTISKETSMQKQKHTNSFFYAQFLKHMKLGEASYFFITPSQTQILLCKMFGACSAPKKQSVPNQKCFCNKYLCMFINLLQVDNVRKINAMEYSEYFPLLFRKRYEIIIDLLKDETALSQVIHKFNYISLLVESELKELLHELQGGGLRTPVLKHWYTMNKNIKNYKKIHELMNNLELHYQRIIFVNNLWIFQTEESGEKIFDQNLMHLTELYAMSLKVFKNSKLAHLEDVDDQIFAHSILAKVYSKLNCQKEMMNQFDEIKQLIGFKTQNVKHVHQKFKNINQFKQPERRPKSYKSSQIDVFLGVQNPSKFSQDLLNIQKQDQLYNWVSIYLQQNKDKAVRTQKDNFNKEEANIFGAMPLFQNSNEVLLNVIQEESGRDSATILELKKELEELNNIDKQICRQATFNVSLRIISAQEMIRAKILNKSLAQGLVLHDDEELTLKIKGLDFSPDKNVVHAIMNQMEAGDICEYFIRGKSDHSRKICQSIHQLLDELKNKKTGQSFLCVKSQNSHVCICKNHFLLRIEMVQQNETKGLLYQNKFISHLENQTKTTSSFLVPNNFGKKAKLLLRQVWQKYGPDLVKIVNQGSFQTPEAEQLKAVQVELVKLMLEKAHRELQNTDPDASHVSKMLQIVYQAFTISDHLGITNQCGQSFLKTISALQKQIVISKTQDLQDEEGNLQQSLNLQMLVLDLKIKAFKLMQTQKREDLDEEQWLDGESFEKEQSLISGLIKDIKESLQKQSSNCKQFQGWNSGNKNQITLLSINLKGASTPNNLNYVIYQLSQNKMEQFNNQQQQYFSQNQIRKSTKESQDQMKDSSPEAQPQNPIIAQTKNQKKKKKKKDKLLMKQQQQQAETSSSPEDDQEQLTNKDQDILSSKQKPSEHSPKETNNEINTMSKKDIEFFQGFSKVSKKGSSVIKQKEEAMKAQELRNSQFNNLTFEQQTLMEYEANKRGFQAPITATSKSEFVNLKAKRKLSNQEQKFIKKKVAQWQDYEKNVKLGRLGFNKKELSKINCCSVIDKCIEFEFDEERYKQWISKVESWDQFLSQNIDKKNQIYSKLVKIRANYKSESEGDSQSSDNNQDWSIKQSDGQKHSTRIKILNAVKRNQNFDEKYEETREDREVRQQIAKEKREIFRKAQEEQQKLVEQSYQFSTSYSNYSQNRITLSESTSQSSYMTNASKLALYKQQEEQETLERQRRQQAYRDRMNNNTGGQAKQTTYIDSDEEEYSDDSDLDTGNAIEEGLKIAQNSLNAPKKTPEVVIKPAILDAVIYDNLNSTERTKQLENLWFKQPSDYKPKPKTFSENNFQDDDFQAKESISNVQKDFAQIYDNPEKFKSAQISLKTQVIPSIPIQKQDSQSLSEGQTLPPNYKTVLCKWYEKFRQCSKGSKCTFAHGQDELNFNRRRQFNSQQQQQQVTPPPELQKPPAIISPSQPPVAPISYPDQIASQQPNLNITSNVDSSALDDYDDEYYDQEEENYKYGYNYRFDKTKHPKFKTEMCRNIKEYGHCTFNGCTFAHSEQELRRGKQNPKLIKYPDLFQY